MNTDELKRLLQRKLGPLPVYAWIAVAAVGVAVAAAIIRKRNGPAPEPAEPVDAGVTDAPAPSPFLPGGFTVPGSGVVATGGGVSPSVLDDTVAERKTNDDWSTEAVRYAIARNIQPTIATSAVAKYLSGESLDVQENAIIDLLLKGIGPTPTPVPPPQIKPTPAPITSIPAPIPTPPATVTTPAVPVTPVAPATPAPSGDITRTVASGSTLYAMYRDVYGVAPTVKQVKAIGSYNGLSVGGAPNYLISPWRAGQVVKFPPTQPTR